MSGCQSQPTGIRGAFASSSGDTRRAVAASAPVYQTPRDLHHVLALEAAHFEL
jgi:hypothetical protein